MLQRGDCMSAGETFISGVTHDGLRALLERYGLGKLETITPLDGGEVNPMLLVNGALVVRFNQRDPDLFKLAKEATIYRRLRHASDVPCPEVLALDTQRDLVPYDVLVLTYVEGVQGSVVWPGLDLSTREQVSEELGRICGTIHGLRWPAYGDVFGIQSARWTDIVMQKAVQNYEQAAYLELIPLRLLDALITTINDGDALFDAASPPALTHTDLGLYNVLLRQVGERWHIAAILDWEWAIIADATWELATLWDDPAVPDPLPDAFLQGYREHYGLASDLRVRRHLYRLIHHLNMALVCHAHFGADRARFHIAALERLLISR